MINYTFCCIVLLYVFTPCKAQVFHKNLKTNKEEAYKTETIPWYFRSPNDSLSGIAIHEINVTDTKNDHGIIVAVIDTEIDTNHEELSYCIWNNPKEIPNNNIDDDQNGYVDDLHGWNFIGNAKKQNIIYSNFEITRILKACNENKIKDTVRCQQAKTAYQFMKSRYEKRQKGWEKALEYYYEVDAALTGFFNSSNYTVEDLKNIKTEDATIIAYKDKLIQFYKGGYTKEVLVYNLEEANQYLALSLNIEYVDREILHENSDSLEDQNYGNNEVSKNLKEFYHATLVAGVMVAKKNNDVGIQGISNTIQIMPLAISSNGDEHDKDIALAIRYAVDNGAKIINMSSGKSFSLHPDWVLDAIKYAEKNNVLFVTSAGNNNLDLDNPKNSYYPIYNDDHSQPNNFIMVGGSTEKIGEQLKRKSSSYGKKTVDIFAPGANIKTTLPNNSYKIGNGTSYATPIVSGVAALIWEQYPKLTASQVKKILMDSSTKYDVKVAIKQEDGTKKLIPFSELSKSGGVVNAYNALLMAEKIAKEQH